MYAYLEVIDGYKVWKEGKQILDSKNWRGDNPATTTAAAAPCTTASHP
jgi:hypothetical protein